VYDATVEPDEGRELSCRIDGSLSSNKAGEGEGKAGSSKAGRIEGRRKASLA